MNKLLLIFLMMSFTTIVFAEIDMISSKGDFENDSSKSQSSPFFITIGYEKGSNKLVHKETSSNSDFISLDKVVNVDMDIVDLTLAKEFFGAGLISLTAAINGSFIIASGSTTDDAITKTANEEGSGTAYGAGLSLNINRSGYGLKIQPFMGIAYEDNHTNYKIKYELKDSADTIVIDNDAFFENVIGSVGIRFFDTRKSLMSYMNLNYIKQLSGYSLVDGTLNNSDIEYDKMGEINKDKWSFSVGFGYFF